VVAVAKVAGRTAGAEGEADAMKVATEGMATIVVVRKRVQVAV
jgi:hypothetical protein